MVYNCYCREAQDYVTRTGNPIPTQSIISLEHPNSPRVLIYLTRNNSSCGTEGKSNDNNKEWVKEKVVVVMPDGCVIEWSAIDKTVCGFILLFCFVYCIDFSTY
jgi:hypothetical protein